MATVQLRIGFVRRGYSRSGGAEGYLKGLAAGVCAHGHEATLVTTAEWPETEWSFGERVALKGGTPTTFADAVERWRPRANCDVIMSLERIWCCDVYRAGDGVHRAWLERRARASGMRARLSAALSAKHRSLLRLEESLFVKGGAGRVIANSQMVKRDIIDFYGYPEERIEVIYNGVALHRFASEKGERGDLGLSANELAVLFVGSGWERKGLAEAVRAVRQLDDARMKLLVAGRGNERRYRGPGVHFFGEVRDLTPLYRAADIFLLPTLYDPFSNACLEALAAGLPIVTTNANGFAEIMTDGVHGSIVEPGDVEALTGALRAWSNAERRAQARAANLALAQEFDIARNVERTLEVLLKTARS